MRSAHMHEKDKSVYRLEAEFESQGLKKIIFTGQHKEHRFFIEIQFFYNGICQNVQMF